MTIRDTPAQFRDAGPYQNRHEVERAAGLYFTPANIIDPALGSGTFLLAACLLLLVNPPWAETP